MKICGYFYGAKIIPYIPGGPLLLSFVNAFSSFILYEERSIGRVQRKMVGNSKNEIKGLVPRRQCQATSWIGLIHLHSLGFFYYYLFRLMRIDLADVCYIKVEEVRNWFDGWRAEKDKEFFRRGVQKLPSRWLEVMAKDEQYIDSNLWKNIFF